MDQQLLWSPPTVLEHQVMVSGRGFARAALVVMVVVTAACGRPESDEPDPAQKDATRAACEEHFPDVRDFEPGTVGGVRNIGPQLVDGPPEPLDVYPDDEPIALCLVPNDTGTFDAVAVIVSDGNTVIRWSVNVADLQSRPA